MFIFVYCTEYIFKLKLNLICVCIYIYSVDDDKNEESDMDTEESDDPDPLDVKRLKDNKKQKPLIQSTLGIDPENSPTRKQCEQRRLLHELQTEDIGNKLNHEDITKIRAKCSYLIELIYLFLSFFIFFFYLFFIFFYFFPSFFIFFYLFLSFFILFFVKSFVIDTQNWYLGKSNR